MDTRLKKKILKSEYSKTELAEKSGIAIWTLQEAMQGRRNLSWENYIKVCEVLECKLWDVLDDEKMELLKKITQWI